MASGTTPWTRVAPTRRTVGLAAAAAGLLLALLLLIAAPARVSLPLTSAGGAGLSPVMLSGVHGVEQNDGHLMRWTTGHMRLRWPGQYGVQPAAVVFTLAGFPGRHPDHVEVRVNARVSRHPVPADYGELRVSLPPDATAPLDIALRSLTTRPPGDARHLGVRVAGVTLENRPLGTRLRPALLGGALGVAALGALAFVAGAWAAGSRTSTSARLAWGAGAWLVAALLVFVLAPAALRSDLGLTLPALVLAMTTTAMLAWRGRQTRLVAVIAGAIAGVQALVVATWFTSAFVDVPRWDIWELVPLLVRQEIHGLTLADLWAPHNEHRPLVSRAVLLANVAITRWNHWYELGLMLVVTALHFLVFVRYVRNAGHGAGIATVVALAGAGTFVATATQWENYLQGWQVALVVGAAAVSGAFLLLATRTLTWRRLAGAAALVLLGTAGFASCLLAWPLGAAAVAVRRGPSWTVKAGVWIVLGVVVGLWYVHGLVHPAGLPPPAPVFSSISALAQVAYGTCIALAMPVWYAPVSFSDTQSLAWWLLPGIGATAIATGASLVAWCLFQVRARTDPAWLFPALLMAFAAGACALTAVGRVPLGMHAMTASRYIVFTGLFWIGLVLLLTVSASWHRAAARRLAVCLATVIVIAGLRAWGDSLPYIELHHVGGSLGREALLRGDVVGAVVLFPSPPVLDERQQYLRRRRLSLFRSGAE